MGWILTNDSVLYRIAKQLTRMERLMTDAQTHLDTVVSNITEAVGNVETEMAALKQAVLDAGVTVDFTAADAAVTRLNAATTAVESDETPPTP